MDLWEKLRQSFSGKQDQGKMQLPASNGSYAPVNDVQQFSNPVEQTGAALDMWAADPNKAVSSTNGITPDMSGYTQVYNPSAGAASTAANSGSGFDWSSLVSPAISAAKGYLATDSDYKKNMAEHRDMLNRSTLASAGIANRMYEPKPTERTGPWQVLMGELEQQQANKQAEAEAAMQKDYADSGKETARVYQDYLKKLTAQMGQPQTGQQAAAAPPVENTTPGKKTKQIVSSKKSTIKTSIPAALNHLNQAIKGGF